MRKDPLNFDTPTPAAKPFDLSKTLTLGAQQAIYNAQELARALGRERIESTQLLLGALQIEPPDAQLGALLQISGLKAEEVRLYAQSALAPQAATSNESLRLSESARNAMRLAGKEARRNNYVPVDVSHIFVACFRPQTAPGLAEILAPLGVSADELSLHLRQLAHTESAKTIKNESPLAQLTAHGERALNAAHTAMRASFCGRISTLHLLIGVLENPDSDAVLALQTLMIDMEELRQRVAVAAASDGEIAGPNRRFTPAAKRALDRAKAAAREGGRNHIGSADLLMGLLPQPLLLIERAQFGARPDDPAAALLRDVDAELVRAIFNPQPAATAPAKSRFVLEVPSRFPLKWFAIFFAIEMAICLMMESLGAWQKNAVRSNVALGLMLLLAGLLIGSGLVTCVMLLFSRDSSRKAACQWSFFGALAGIMFGMATSGVFK